MLTFADAHVFYPIANPERCTAALLLDVDPIRLSRRTADGDDAPLEPYVDDRPYASSSFPSVAIAQVFGFALAGKCRDRPELAHPAIPAEAAIESLACRGADRFSTSSSGRSGGASGLWAEMETDWAVVDVELMPSSAKAQQLLKEQYAAVGRQRAPR